MIAAKTDVIAMADQVPRAPQPSVIVSKYASGTLINNKQKNDKNIGTRV